MLAYVSVGLSYFCYWSSIIQKGGDRKLYFEQPAASPGGLGGFFGLCLISATSLHPNLQQVQRWYQWKLSNAVTVFMIIERCGMILTGACAQLSKAVMPEHSLQDMDVLGLHKLEHLEKECSCVEWQELAVILQAWHSSNLNLMQIYYILCQRPKSIGFSWAWMQAFAA